MKTLTLTQPWATLVAIGAKRIETRSWKTEYRGPLAIHAAKSFPAYAKDCAQNARVFRRALGWPEPPSPITQEWLDAIKCSLYALPLGQVLATCRLTACTPTEVLDNGSNVFSVSLPQLSEQEKAFGNYETGRYGFTLEDIEPLKVPVPAKGARTVRSCKLA